MAKLRRLRGLRHPFCGKRLFGVFLVVTLLVAIITGGQFGFGPQSVLKALAKDSEPHFVGLADMEMLEQSHPSYGQLQAVEEQILICEDQWYDYLRLMVQQASLDGLESPFLQEISQSVSPGGTEELEVIASLWEEAQLERENYQEKLNQEMEENVNLEKVRLEKELAEQVDRIQRRTRQEILDRQVELALRKLTQSEAEALLNEIEVLQAQSDEEIQRLQEKFNDRLQSRLDAVKKAALEQLKSYDQDLVSQMTAKLDKLQSEPIASAGSGDDYLAGDYPEMLWQQQLGSDYWLNTGNVDILEAQLLKGRAGFEEKMEPLRARYTEIQQEIQADLEADIAEVAQVAGLTLILDKNQTQAQGIDITNQVLVILQGEA
ncbi:MAG: hypothetical protein GX977_10480 [Firmicutes bacterium]|nr:hypothetical protein [Bacillota bacterium]